MLADGKESALSAAAALPATFAFIHFRNVLYD